MRSVIFIFLFALVFSVALAQKNNTAKKFDGYLFAYFEGAGVGAEQEQLRFAASSNGTDWFALNHNKPIISSQTIAASGGIRDPHILRSHDGKSFFITATDMSTHKNGWDRNTGIVMMKSKDLLSWSSVSIDLSKIYPKKFGDVKWVWAPQTIYHPEAKKYLVYFTVRYHNNTKLDFYAAYANRDFTGFEQEPKLMFSPKFGGIDGDIIFKDNLYHFFFKGNTKVNGEEVKNGIQQATSKTLWGPWVEDFKYVDAYADTAVSVEGSSIFKLNNSEDYVLMYDLYTKGKYEYQTTRDLYSFSAKPMSFTKNFNPRHGSVISITTAEARQLNSKWGGVPGGLLQPKVSGDTYTFTAKENPIITHHYTADLL